MKNPYSLVLLAIMFALISIGALILALGGLFLGPVGLLGFIPFVFGGLMIQGFSWPKDNTTSKVWLIRCFGQITTTKVTGLTFLMDWLPFEIVGKVEIDLAQKDHDFMLKKPIRCSDGVYLDNKKSLISTGMQADNRSGESLKDFQNVGGMKGAIEQLDDMLTMILEPIASLHTSEWMETHGAEIKDLILPIVEGKVGMKNGNGNPDNDDARHLGLIFPKFQVVLVAPEEVIKARNNNRVQIEKREAELINTETMHMQIMDRYRLFSEGRKDKGGNIIVPPTPANLIPSLVEIRAMIIQENLMQAGKVSEVTNKGGVNIVQTPT